MSKVNAIFNYKSNTNTDRDRCSLRRKHTTYFVELEVTRITTLYFTRHITPNSVELHNMLHSRKQSNENGRLRNIRRAPWKK